MSELAVLYGGALDGLEIEVESIKRDFYLIKPNSEKQRRLYRYKLTSVGPPLRFDFVSEGPAPER